MLEYLIIQYITLIYHDIVHIDSFSVGQIDIHVMNCSYNCSAGPSAPGDICLGGCCCGERMGYHDVCHH